MEQLVSERLKILIEAREKGNKAAFGRALGITSQSVADMLELKGGPSFATIQKILKAYPDLSLEWLITGEGQMIKGQQPEATDHTQALQTESETLIKLSAAEQLLREKDQQLEAKDRQLSFMERQINKLWALVPDAVGKLLSSSDAAGSWFAPLATGYGGGAVSLWRR